MQGEKQLRPKLTLFVQLEDGRAVDASLTPETRLYLEQLALSQGRTTSTPPAIRASSVGACLQSDAGVFNG